VFNTENQIAAPHIRHIRISEVAVRFRSPWIFSDSVLGSLVATRIGCIHIVVFVIIFVTTVDRGYISQPGLLWPPSVIITMK